MKILVLGGSKSGKSDFALQTAVRLSGEGKRYYVATMIPRDGEDSERIARHIADRADMGFETVEAGRDIGSILDGMDTDGTFLIDSVTALLSNEMFRDDSAVDMQAESRCTEALLSIAEKVKNAVFVSDHIFSDAERYDETTEAFRKTLGYIHLSLAKNCDAVIELCAGMITVHKGRLPE